MATLTLTHSQMEKRYDADTLLTGDNLGRAFHQLFDTQAVGTKGTQERYKLKAKVKKKGSHTVRDKSKSKKQRDHSVEKADLGLVPDIELVGNPSSFAVYSNVRQAVLTCLMQQLSASLQSIADGQPDTDSEEDEAKLGSDVSTRIPKIVGVGLCSVFELIHETQSTHPSLCIRALQALFDILQGQPPEGLRSEPPDTIDSLYQLLMELAQSRGPGTTPTTNKPMESECESLSAIACSCLISLVVARGDTGKLLTAIAAMLMFSARLAKQEIKIPRCLTSLQQSVQAVLVGRVQMPDWLTHGIPKEARVMSCYLSPDVRPSGCSAVQDNGSSESLVSDGKYLYLHSANCGLLKIGSGYGNTVMGHIYASNASFHNLEQGRLVIVKNQLLYKPLMGSNGKLIVFNTETLQPVHEVCLEGKGFDANAMFSDGDNIGFVSPSRDTADCFVVRMYSPFNDSHPTLVSELPLKLARKCLDVFGAASFDLTESTHGSINAGAIDEDAVSIQAGKEFALMRTSNGKILYTGKAQALGLKPPNASSSPTVQLGTPGSRWSELCIIKSPKIVQYSVGHEGTHCLLVADDGSVFFVGVAKRGEDGDAGSLSKVRRQAKAVKPKKMIRVEGKMIVSSACNSGSSALLTQDGEVHVFGKDTLYCDHVTGLLNEMKGIVVTSIALGKAHGVLLTNRGHVYTFGLNNKGQCGRDYAGGAAKELFQAVTMADEEEYEDDILCPPGKHRWLHRDCMVCTVCEECTGYGSSCINNSSQEERVPGHLCSMNQFHKIQFCSKNKSLNICLGAFVTESTQITNVDCGLRLNPPDSTTRYPCYGCTLCLCCLCNLRHQSLTVVHVTSHFTDPERMLVWVNQSAPGIVRWTERCGCGSGDSGCGECGACRTCAGEVIDPACAAGGLANGVFLDDLGHVMEHAEGGFDIARGRVGAKNSNPKRGRAKQKHPPSWLKAEVAAGSDHELDHMKLASLSPGRVDLDGVAVQIACGLYHTVVLMDNGDIHTFGSNQYGQLGSGDTNTRGCPSRVVGIKSSVTIKQVAAGCNHTVLLSADGQVYTFGNNQKNQLGRMTEDGTERVGDRKSTLIPRPVPGIGAKQARRATWIGASGDQTFIRIDESLINAHTLSRSNIVANAMCIGLVPTVDIGRLNIKCLMINRADGSCRSFSSPDQTSLIGHSVCLDPVYDNLWSYNPLSNEISCYNVVSASARSLTPACCDVMSPEYAMPVRYGRLCPRSHCAVNLLGCLDVLTTAHAHAMTVSVEERERQTTTTSFTKEDYSTINRFESYGGGWGYSGHSIEAVRFSCDSDVLLGGFGLFGGRGEYFGKIKLFELGIDVGDNEVDGELLAETDELPYRCSAREKHALLFDEPVLIQANLWYVAWARISGPSSDCGSSGLSSVTTDDQIVFRFKNSKKSNNGTDTSAGQIPLLFYRLPTTDSGNCMTSSSCRKAVECTDPVHVLSSGFSRTVSPECFESLLGLLSWSWSTFCMLGSELPTVRGSLNQRAAILDLEQLVFISSASLRLIRTYICQVYPAIAGYRIQKSCTSETPRLAECVGEVRLLLRQILSESGRYHLAVSREVNCYTDGQRFEALRERILDECHNTFIGCFHAFYPTANLKWLCLCELLSSSDPSRDVTSSGDGGGRLLAAILEALCQMTTTKLTDIIPIGGVLEQSRISTAAPRFRNQREPAVADDNKSSANCSSGVGAAAAGEAVYFPMLVGHMLHQTEMELIGRSHFWTFRDILDRLLMVAGLPIRYVLRLEKTVLPSRLVHNACWLLATLVGELAHSATGTEIAVVASSRPLLSTPNRFGRTSQGAYWNSGNGNPDAVCFSVDRPGIIIAGAGIYGGGGGSYEYELELLEDMDRSNDPNPNGRWNTLELVKGLYGAEDCVNDVADVKFDKAVPIKENIKYALRLRNRGQRTRNGDIGMAKLKCSDGTVFSFSSCTLSSNGTNHSRGQIPTILYYSSSQDLQSLSESSHSLAAKQARKSTITIVGAVFKTGTELLQLARSSSDANVLSALHESSMFSMLIPMVSAYIGPVVGADPSGAVQILKMVQEILSPVTALCINHMDSVFTDDKIARFSRIETNQYHAVVESDHPYKPSAVHNYRVKFPSVVKWLSVEFDRRCGTAQPEDSLQLYIPARSSAVTSRSRNATEDNVVVCETLDSVDAWWPVLKKFHGTDAWPSLSVMLPGSEVSFSLETASDYVKDEKACSYGFRCTVTGYEWPSSHEQGFAYLEYELSGLGASCASALIKKDIVLPTASGDDICEDFAVLEASVKQEFVAHASVLSHGLSLLHPPTVLEALDGNLAWSGTSSERSFLLDFIDCTPDTSGGRLAAWLQPESYIDPKQCVISHISDDIRFSWPVALTVLTKDQYGNAVHAPKLKMEVVAIPVMKDQSEKRRMKRLSRFDASDGNLVFGGHPPPRLDVPYHVTIKDNRDSYHAICIMKAYENYSFEELRYATPAARRPSENMLVRDNSDGSYGATWTPASMGCYQIQIKLDGCDAACVKGEPMKVNVLEAPHNVAAPPVQQQTFRTPAGQLNKLRKFAARDSAGLRVRLHPSLQSEQIGLVTFGGVISFTDETHNDDGVWLRLSADSVREFCSPLNGYTEGWTLQYNQHIGKMLLIPVEDTRQAVDDLPKDPHPPHQAPPSGKQVVAVDKRNGFPSTFTAIKCGTSGHNVRVAPSLDSTAIGMVVVGNQLTATREVKMSEGVWLQLDKSSTRSYCHDTNGDAWCLARSASGEVYLRSQSDLEASITELAMCSAHESTFGATASEVKGFDFTSASRSPVFSAFSNVPVIGVFGSAGSGFSGSAEGHFKVNGHATDIAECNGEVHHDETKSEEHNSSSVDAFACRGAGRSIADPLGKARSASLRRESAPYSFPISSSGKSASPPSVGLGVREPVSGLVRRIGAEICQKVSMPFPDLPPELQGVSVKDLVKALGESRVNGNGVTPPRTPPGTPKKTMSRSSSPRAPLSVSAASFHEVSGHDGSSAISSVSPLPALSVMSVQTALSTSATAELNRLSPVAVRAPVSGHGHPEVICSPALNSQTKSTMRSCSTSPMRVEFISVSTPRAQSASPNLLPSSDLSTQGIAAAKDAVGSKDFTDCFRLGFSPRKESPKSVRKERSRVLRSKQRDRAISPGKSSPAFHQSAGCTSGKLPNHVSSSSAPLKEPGVECVRHAMTPSVALCMRAVFASFVWHEGIVHDAMACASYLKFHPLLLKDVPRQRKHGLDKARTKAAAAAEDACEDGSKFTKPISSASEAGNINETVRRACQQLITPRGMPSKERQIHPSDFPVRSDLAVDVASPLPETLCYLVLFWEELAKVTLKVIDQSLMSPVIDPAAASMQDGASAADKSINRAKSSAKKSKDGKSGSPAAPALRGNLFGAAAGRVFAGGAAAEGGADKEMPCELCGGNFAHPVTYHMRQMHPGCGRPAGGQGYNSGGNFCGGWAGNCGDGGIGGSTWYLMCEKCRSRYLTDKRRGAGSTKDKGKKTDATDKKRLSTVSSQLSALEPHVAIRNNAMFILELADGTCSGHVLHAMAESDHSCGSLLPVLSENGSCTSQNPVGLPTRQTPFLYLSLCGGRDEDSAFSDADVVYCHSASSSNGSVLDRSNSVGSAKQPRSRPLSTYAFANGGVDKSAEHVSAGAVVKASFQRSISEMGGIGGAFADVDSGQTLQETAIVGRRRNNSVGDSGGGMSLLKRPSVDMSRLIKSTKHSNDLANSILCQPVVTFIMQRHDLDTLRRVMTHAARRAACRTYALQALNSLVRSVANPGCLHHLLWNFVSSLHSTGSADDEFETQLERNIAEPCDSEQDVAVCSHPLTDVMVAGDVATQPLVGAFHSFLQTVADVMMHVPPGSALQRIAVRCWSLRFRPADHMFLHRCHVFSNISQILSRSDDVTCVGAGDSLPCRALVECLQDLTNQCELRVSSRAAMIGGMTDSSTETFWESGDEDKTRNKVISIACNFAVVSTRLRVISLHIDNARDLGNKVSSVSFSAGPSSESMCNLRHAEIDPRHAGWVSAWVSDTQARFVRVELKGPDNTLRVRQVKILGEVPGAGVLSSSGSLSAQQRECEAETLSVFRLLASLVFGQLVSESACPVNSSAEARLSASDVDLKEHMVGILFSRSGELTRLQRQVCSHIVGAIRRETVRVRTAWEHALSRGADKSSSKAMDPEGSDSYCFELLSLVLALSGSIVGRRYIAQQYNLIEDLVSLLHAASPRVQRQIIALVRRILPDIAPRSFATVLGIGTGIPVDLSAVARSTEAPDRRFILDVFLACIAKSLSVQIKSKAPGVKAVSTSTSIVSCLESLATDQWWLRGSITPQLAESMIVLLTDMASGKLGSDWTSVAKVAIASPIISLSRLSASQRSMEECVRTTTLWLALAALCVLGEDHVDKLSTGRLSAASEGGLNSSSRPMCANHDDDETVASVLCSSGCGSLCSECDRILHLSKRFRQHQRQVFKEEEESIRVDLHEGCGRVKLYWLLALADSRTLKAVVEFRQVAAGDSSVACFSVISTSRAVAEENCRFCGAPAQPDLLLPGAVCSQPECMEFARHACSRVLPCGHVCGGIRDESQCLPCLHGCQPTDAEHGKPTLRQDADDMCMICFTDALSTAPVILLECGHAFHSHCCRSVLERRWPGPRITFAFMLCPICKRDISHPSLDSMLFQARARRDDVRRKALMRLEYEGAKKQDSTTSSERNESDLVRYAMERYAYYVCHKCGKAYYGGEARCEQQAAVSSEDYDPSELVCGACSDVSRAQMCARHGADFLEYKCRYCCSVAVFFCFGTTHFCGACHDDFQRVTTIPRPDLPQCPAGPRAVQLTGDECPLHVQHPATGEEFALGCGICRNAHTF